jgi:hypothetical protein
MTNTLATVADVILGKVTERKGARLHLEVAGRAHCGAGRGIIAEATRRTADGELNPGAVCLRCRKALRAALAGVLDAATAAGGMMTPAEANARNAANLFATPAEIAARDAEIAAGIRAAARARREAQDAELARIAAGSHEHRVRLLAELAAMPMPAGFEDYAA